MEVSMAESQAQKDARRETRRRTLKRALVFVEGAPKPTWCTLQNWSHNGARLKIKTDLKPGMRLQMTIYFGELEVASRKSTVRWSNDGHAGVEFDTPLAFETLF